MSGFDYAFTLFGLLLGLALAAGLTGLAAAWLLFKMTPR